MPKPASVPSLSLDTLLGATMSRVAEARRYSWSILLAATTAILIVVSLYALLAEQPAFHFSQDTYFALTPSVCPGDVVQWQDERVVTRGSVTAIIVITLWSVDQQRTVKADSSPEGFVWLRPTTIRNHLSYMLPSALPPGPYEIHVGDHRSRPGAGSAYSVPFRVEACE